MIEILLIVAYYLMRKIYKDVYKFVALLIVPLTLIMLVMINFGKFEAAEEVAGLVLLFYLILVAEVVIGRIKFNQGTNV